MANKEGRKFVVPPQDRHPANTPGQRYILNQIGIGKHEHKRDGSVRALLENGMIHCTGQNRYAMHPLVKAQWERWRASDRKAREAREELEGDE